MKIINPPSPPFGKGGLGGFGIVLVVWNFEIICALVFGLWNFAKRQMIVGGRNIAKTALVKKANSPFSGG